MIEFFYSTPFIIRVCLSLALILAANKLSKNLALSAVIGTAALALWCGHTVYASFNIALGRISSGNTLMLLAAVSQILVLSSQMSESGLMKDLVESIRTRVSRRISIALLPAVIGLLPMPGGAIFSAPLVDQCDEAKTMDPLLKTKINYWFRHIWEYWWPLYPGVLLAVELTGLSIPRYMLLQFPMSIAAALCGYFFMLKKIDDKTGPSPGDKRDFKQIALPLSPIIIIVILYAIINISFPWVSRCNKYLPIIIGIFIAQIFLQWARPLGASEWKKMILSGGIPKLLVLVAAILVYGSFIEAPLPDGSLIVFHMRHELTLVGFPVILIVILIPFFSAFTTGLSVGFVGASFPIVISLLGPDPSLADMMAAAVLAYGAGYTGMILSPVHICLVVTNDHFETSLGKSILSLLPPALIILGFAIISHYAIKALF